MSESSLRFLTFYSRLLLHRPLQKRLQTPQDVLLSQEVKDFLCIVLQSQAFPDEGQRAAETHIQGPRTRVCNTTAFIVTEEEGLRED